MKQDRAKLKLQIACVLALTTTGYAQSFIVADSAAGFSGTQGQNGWYYGFIPGNAYDVTAFSELKTYRSDVSTGIWTHPIFAPPYTLVSAIGQHPSDLPNSPTELSVRRWISDVAETVTISGNIAKSDAGGGNGIGYSIYVDGNLKLSGNLAFDDLVGINYSFTTAAAIGGKIDLVINANGDDRHDSTGFTATITAVPEPTAYAVMAGAGLLGFAAWRRTRR